MILQELTGLSSGGPKFINFHVTFHKYCGDFHSGYGYGLSSLWNSWLIVPPWLKQVGHWPTETVLWVWRKEQKCCSNAGWVPVKKAASFAGHLHTLSVKMKQDVKSNLDETPLNVPLTLSPPIPLRLHTLPYWSNPPFLISDIRALWRSGLSARAPECQKLKIVG